MKRDNAIFDIIQQELHRQQEGIELIASENFTSQQVMEAMGSCLTNKYAEGYPGKRYYGGCQCVDLSEQLAIDRAKEIFGAVWANVQPHSGAQANAAVMLACLKPGDAILGFDLSHGGHLTHGSSVNFSGQLYSPNFYGVEQATGLIDMDKVEAKALEVKPKMIICGASAYSRDWDYARFRAIADKVGAILLADISHPAGLIAAKLLADPIPHCHIVTTTTQGGPLEHVIAAKAVAFFEILQPEYKVYAMQVKQNAQAFAKALVAKDYHIVSGGTDNHLMLIDLRNKNISGKKAENTLVKADITLNKNMVPFDDKSPFITSGIRIGTAAITSRGMKEEHMPQIVEWIDTLLMHADDEAIIAKTKESVNQFMKQFPLYV